MITKEIINIVTDQLQEKSPDIIRKVKQWIYDAKIDMARLHDFSCLTFQYLVNGNNSDYIPLPLEFGKFIKQNPIVIDGKSIANFSSNINNSTTFTLNQYIPSGAVVSIVSSSNVDSGNKIVVYDSQNNEREILETNGTTPVSSTIAFDSISTIWKDETSGKITLTVGTETIVMPKEQSNLNFKSIEFNRAVDSSEEIDIKFVKQILKITDDYSIDEMNANYAHAITLYCQYRGFLYQEDEMKTKEMYQLYTLELQKCIKEDMRNRKINNFNTIRPREVT